MKLILWMIQTVMTLHQVNPPPTKYLLVETLLETIANHLQNSSY